LARKRQQVLGADLNRSESTQEAVDPCRGLEFRFMSALGHCLGASPHQQGRDTKMAMLSFGGIDVSKDRLDITVLPDEQINESAVG
jgi:hypothetical protein